MAVRQEITDFVAGAFLGTRKQVIKWETTADPNVLTAPLDKAYTLRLEQVIDFDGEPDAYDHILTLLKSGKVVFQVDRRDLELADLNRRLGTGYDHLFQLFFAFWEDAALSAQKVPPEVAEVGQILWERLRSN